MQKTLNASEPEFVEQTIKPFDNTELYVANEAYRSAFLASLLHHELGATVQAALH